MNIKLLEKLCLTAGVPGREYRITELIKREIKGLFDSVTVDPLGSIIAVKKPSASSKVGKKSTKKRSTSRKAPKKVMLAAHMDQIGFLVTHIDDKGFIHVNPVGGFDTRNLFARAVTICPDLKDPKKDITGIMNPSGRPVHIAPPEERKRIPEVRDFIIDTGMDKKQVEKKVKLGDMVVINAPCYQLGDYMVSQAMDNRIACWVAIEAMKKLKDKKHDCEIHCVFTVQEEVGLRGAIASAHTIQPDIGIGIDITLACDTPGVPAIDNVTKLGDGASIVVMDSSIISDHGMVEDFDKLAKKHKIKAQRAIMARGGTDTGGIQRTAGGCKAMTLGVPGRYIHTVTEMCHKDDLAACRDLLARYLENVK